MPWASDSFVTWLKSTCSGCGSSPKRSAPEAGIGVVMAGNIGGVAGAAVACGVAGACSADRLHAPARVLQRTMGIMSHAREVLHNCISAPIESMIPLTVPVVGIPRRYFLSVPSSRLTGSGRPLSDVASTADAMKARAARATASRTATR